MGDEEGTTPWGQTSPAGTPLEEHGRFSRGAALAFRSSNLMLPFACHVNIPKLYIESSFFFTATDVRSLRVSIWGDTRCWISPRRCAFVVVCYIVVEGIFPREIVVVGGFLRIFFSSFAHKFVFYLSLWYHFTSFFF